MRRPLRTAVLLASLGVLLPPLARAQALRLHGTTTTQYVQLRPITYDSAADSGSGAFVPLPVSYAAPFTQDLELSAWGLGVTGLRAYALVRGRAALGSALIWPQSDTHFEALYAYLELQRPTYLLRGGRQQHASGLGWYAFDGLTAAWTPLPAVRLEAYGGRGLARASLESYNSSAITSLDPLRPDQGTILAGASVWAAPTARSTVSALYQREALDNGSGLVSEQATFDGRLGLGPHLLLSGSANADIARAQWGKASASATVLLRGGSLALEVFQYRPTLDLATIWGAFAPESHDGWSATATVPAASDLALSAAYTHRVWQPLSTGSPFLVDVGSVQDEVSLGAHARRGNYTLDGGYHLQLGYGGDQSGGDVDVAWAPADGWRVGVQGTAFQQTELFRVADGTVFGLGASVRTPLGRRLGLSAEATRYFHRRLTGTTGIDWNQTRAAVSLDWTIGADADHVAGGSYR